MKNRVFLSDASSVAVPTGMVSTSASTRALIALLANHPEIQTRMQREIDEKIGEAEPRLKDKEEMPYTMAVCFPENKNRFSPVTQIPFQNTL